MPKKKNADKPAEDHNTEHDLRAIYGLLSSILIVEEEIRDLLQKWLPRAVSTTVTFGGNDMDIKVHVSDTPKTAMAHEWTGPNGTGVEVPPIGAITWTSDNPAAVTVNPTSGLLAYVAAGVANISFTDAGNSITGTGQVTVVADVAVSGTVDFV